MLYCDGKFSALQVSYLQRIIFWESEHISDNVAAIEIHRLEWLHDTSQEMCLVVHIHPEHGNQRAKITHSHIPKISHVVKARLVRPAHSLGRVDGVAASVLVAREQVHLHVGIAGSPWERGGEVHQPLKMDGQRAFLAVVVHGVVKLRARLPRGGSKQLLNLFVQ